MGPKRNKGKGGGGDRQGQPSQQTSNQPQQQQQHPPQQSQGASGGHPQERPQQQQQQQQQRGKGKQPQKEESQQPQAWRQQQGPQQQSPQQQAVEQQGPSSSQQRPQQQPQGRREQSQSQAPQKPQAWGQGQGPQQQPPPPQGGGRQQQGPPGFQQKPQQQPQARKDQTQGQGQQKPQAWGQKQGSQQQQQQQPQPQAAAPPPSVWSKKPGTAPPATTFPAMTEIEKEVKNIQPAAVARAPPPVLATQPSTEPASRPAGRGDGKGRGKGQQKPRPGAEKPGSASGPSQAAAPAGPSQEGTGDLVPEKEKIVSSKPSSQPVEDMLVMSPRRFIDQKSKPGRPILVETNHLAISFKKQNVIAYHYDVTFEPDKPKYLIRPAWNEFAARFFKGRFPSFDGKKNVYSNGPLPRVEGGVMQETIEVYNKENDRNKEFKITIKYAAQIDLSAVLNYVGAKDETGTRVPRDALQAIDIVLRNLSANQLVQSGRLFFSPPAGRVYALGEGLDMWYGFHQSAILGWKPYLNVDIAHKGFPTPCDLLETLRTVCEWDGNSSLDRWQSETFRKYIRRLKVEYKIPSLPSSKRVYRVNDIGEPASSLRFTLDNGQETTVAAYYEREKNCRLRYPHLPCLWVGSTQATIRIYIAMEFCKIVEGQVINGKMSEDQTAKMVREAAKGTDIRKKRIMDQIRQANINSSPYANEFGISVAGEFEKVQARVLAAPELKYDRRTQFPRAGVWRASAFEKPQALIDWCVICLDPRTRPDSLDALERHLKTCAADLNMNTGNPIYPPRKINSRDLKELTANLREVFQDLLAKKVKIVFVVVRDKGEDYSTVKKLSELKFGILTQCIKATTVFKKLNDATVKNILLKVNAKLNGVNHVLAVKSLPVCLQKPCMVVGADVTHPSPDSTDIPSVAAVAASHSPNAFEYNMIVRLQDPRDEMIRDLENIMKDQLRFFYSRTRYKPEKILFFRDGVSDGQIPHVFNIEFQAIRRACTSLQADYKPPITFVIVQKRHHTRFFPTNPKDCDDQRNLNVPAGTCVDTHIVHPRETDFYLVSHASIQGTARPTKYRLVWDDNNLGEVELENLTYYLCHLFSRCTRSVSYPAPTYNAHLAAFRGRVYLEGEKVNLQSLDREQKKIEEKIRAQAPMHFV